MTTPSQERRWTRTRWTLRWGLRAFFVYMVAGYLSATVEHLPALPEDSTSTEPTASRGDVVMGVFSVHTEQSHDAYGSLDDVGVAARAAGLDFVVLGDHPADPRRPNWTLHPTSYREGVLVVPGQELVARQVGRVLGLGLDTTFHRWNEGPEALSAFFERAGGSIFVVHGRSPRNGERWRVGAMDGVDGWEVLDMSETVKDGLRLPWAGYHLVTFLVALPLGRGDAALLHLAFRNGFDIPSVQAFDSLHAETGLAAIAGLNHHSQIRLGDWLIPPFEPFFRTFVNHFAVDAPLSPEPAIAEVQIVEAAKMGGAWMSMGHHDEAQHFDFAAFQGARRVGGMGRSVAMATGTTLRAGFSTEATKVVYRVLRNGRTVKWVDGPTLQWTPGEPGRYRVEVYRHRGRWGRWALKWRPWILTNPITIRAAVVENGVAGA